MSSFLTIAFLLPLTLILFTSSPGSTGQCDGKQHGAPAFTPLAIGSNGCENDQLALIYSESGPLHAYAMVQGANDHLVIAGTTGPECFLAEISGTADVIWSKSVDIMDGREETITRIKLDADGHLLCIGRNTESIADWFVMRIDLTTQQIMWMTRFDDVGDFVVRDFMDPGPGRTLVIVGSERNSPAPGFSTDMFIRGLDRNTGEIISQPFNNLNIGSAEDGVAIVADGSDYYVVGRYTRTGGFSDIRMGLSRLDAEGGEVWSRMLHVPLNISARLYGRNLALKNGDVYFIGSGDPDGTSSTSTLSYLGRMTRDGDLVFLKEIDISSFDGQSLTSLTPTLNGFLISCFQKEAGRTRGLIRVDDNGNLLSALDYGEGLNADPYGEFEVVAANDSTVTVIKTTLDHSPEAAVEILQFNLYNPNFDANGCTGLEPLDVAITDVPNPANVDIDLVEYLTNTTTAGAPIPLSDIDLQDSLLCSCIEICDNGIDDDMDGLIDCADPELFDSCCCLTILPMDLGPDQAIDEGDTAFIFINEGYEGATWSTGEGGLFIAVTDEGWYWAEEEICDSLIRDSVYVTVIPYVDSCAAELFIPNVFTPNGDGINDHLEVSFPDGLFRPIVFRVFDRWGGVVFETEDPHFKWYGTSGEKVLTPGVYVYMLEVICMDMQTVISGDVTIIH